jgi:enamine deaminase RidA (YjgF/YER057c/UK114 family)
VSSSGGGRAKRQILVPRSVPAPPPGRYSQAAIVEARRLLVIAGQIAVDRRGRLVGAGDFKRQFNQVYRYLGALLREYGATFGDVIQFTTYLVDARDLPLVHRLCADLYKTLYPRRDYPPNTLLVVDRLVLEELRLEIEALVALD